MGLFFGYFCPICLIRLSWGYLHGTFRGGEGIGLCLALKPTKYQIDYRLISDALRLRYNASYTYKIEKPKNARA